MMFSLHVYFLNGDRTLHSVGIPNSPPPLSSAILEQSHLNHWIQFWAKRIETNFMEFRQLQQRWLKYWLGEEWLNSPFTAVLNNDKQTKMGRNDHPHKFEGHILTLETERNWLGLLTVDWKEIEEETMLSIWRNYLKWNPMQRIKGTLVIWKK